jgi:hypothetical protein
MPFTLFIVKKFYDYDGYSLASSGLLCSASFVVDMLLSEGHKAKLVTAIDGNSVDSLVTQNKPDRVVIEALWVTPTKLAELQKLHPSVKWTVRLHSEIPFLSNEGIAVEWIAAYLKQGVEVAFNSDQTQKDFSVLGPSTYLPNYYPLRKHRPSKPRMNCLDIGCFGAIRPLKNQLIQAVAAVKFAKAKGKKLFFHMNNSRVEQFGQSNLKNIQALMAATGQVLVLHPWADHNDFLELLADMDICLQVSLSESFNITAADAVSMGVPLVGSEAIPWLPKRSQADVDSAESIYDTMEDSGLISVGMNHAALKSYIELSVSTWNRWLKS